MSSIPSVTPKKILRILQKEGFFIHHQKGSHVILKTPNDVALRVTVPMHNKDLKRKTLISILKQSGLDKRILS